MDRAGRWGLAAVAMVALLVAVGCDDTGARDPDVGVVGETTAAPDGFAYVEIHDAAEHMEVWARLLAIGLDEHAALAGAPDSAAASLVTELDFLLRGHTASVAQATQAALERRPEALVAALEVVSTTTEELETLVRETLGEEAARGVGELWRGHVEQEIRYAQAVATGDETSRQRAREELAAAGEQLTSLLLDHLGQHVEREAIGSALGRHVEAVIAVIEVQAGQRPWFARLREALDQAGTLAETLAPPLAQVAGLSGDATAPAASLRAELSRHMAESVWFTVPHTRLVLDEGSPELREAARELASHNTAELEDTVARALDGGAAERFGELWARHHDLLAEAAGAVGSGEGAVSRVRRTLEREFARPLGRVLEDATDGALHASGMRSEAAVHVETMLDLIEAQAG